MIAVRKLIESLKIGLQKGVNNIMIKKKEVIYVTNDTPTRHVIVTYTRGGMCHLPLYGQCFMGIRAVLFAINFD